MENNEGSFLSRWSQRKLQPKEQENKDVDENVHAEVNEINDQITTEFNHSDQRLINDSEIELNNNQSLIQNQVINIENDKDNDSQLNSRVENPSELNINNSENEQEIDEEALSRSIENIDESSNVSDFLVAGVSQALKKAALRKVFHQSAYNFRDGLNEYDDDYTTLKKLPADVSERLKNMLKAQTDENERSNNLATEVIDDESELIVNDSESSIMNENNNEDTSVEEHSDVVAQSEEGEFEASSDLDIDLELEARPEKELPTQSPNVMDEKVLQPHQSVDENLAQPEQEDQLAPLQHDDLGDRNNQ
ncbi:DUF3306 domain-containing protein [Vibrio sp. SS-MA-C1-2]|uniref:DUF3306 domain-containing protein n=1 Tax=Vibrio sp. SS-MA-C1-2 TaxID=2908646 RepID=UPI001F2CF81F|nr:DUF3306 domain-containing protein [Vibrio sp. SS-MA-C1-2]UJF18151.1 DUF3306 domain-containing protein [Vibrio sp. SS-MA-C1-2]